MTFLFKSPASVEYRWLIVFILFPFYSFAQNKIIKEKVESWGGRTFFKRGVLVEVHLNKAKFLPGELSILKSCQEITDLSLERTQVSEEDLVSISNMPKLAWLNLYLTKIGDSGARILSRSKSIRLLPLGQTGITDQAMLHIGQMKQLILLGFAGQSDHR